jgi:hypothetical protein
MTGQKTTSDSAWDRFQTVLGWVALVSIMVITFSYSFQHVVANLAQHGVSDHWRNPVAAITELLAFGFGIEIKRRVKAGMGGWSLFFPVTGLATGVGMVLWSNIVERTPHFDGLIVAVFPPTCTLIVLGTIETARRDARKRTAVRPAARPVREQVPAAFVPSAPVEPVGEAVQPEPVAAQAVEPATRLTGRFAAAADARQIFAETGGWPTRADLMRLGHSDGSSRRGLELAQEQEAGDEQSPALRVVNE